MLVGKFIRNINSKFKGHFFSGLSFNSLNLKKNNIFFAIKGTKINGNKIYTVDDVQTAMKNLDYNETLQIEVINKEGEKSVYNFR